MPATGVRNPSGLQVAAYGGANCVLIAMSVPDNQTKDLAGFTIWRRREGEAEQPLLNRLNFDDRRSNPYVIPRRLHAWLYLVAGLRGSI